MPIRRIRLLGEPVLRKKCHPVRNVKTPAVKALVRDLRATLADFRRRHGFGRGIAAPQIGVGSRVIFIGFRDLGALINPRITKRSKTRFRLWDDCFSFPDILVRLTRAKRIDVEFVDAHGTKRRLTARGPLSELLQHEIDHLDGVLAVDRAETMSDIVLRGSLSFTTKKRRRKR